MSRCLKRGHHRSARSESSKRCPKCGSKKVPVVNSHSKKPQNSELTEPSIAKFKNSDG